MISGYYKYIVFDYPELRQVTGQVFSKNDLGYRIEGTDLYLENAEWIARNHQCPPIYYGWEYSDLSVDELRNILFYDDASL
jgi:hypothetical protein